MIADRIHDICRATGYFGEFFRRMRAKLGTAQAITATAHKIARILYHVLSPKEPYTETIFHLYDEQAHQRAEIRLRKRTFLRLLKKLGKIRDTTLQVSKIEFRNPPVLGHVHRVFWWPLALVNAPSSTLTFSERLDSEEERAT